MLPQKATDIGSVLSNINSEEQEQEQDEGKKRTNYNLTKSKKQTYHLTAENIL